MSRVYKQAVNTAQKTVFFDSASLHSIPQWRYYEATAINNSTVTNELGCGLPCKRLFFAIQPEAYTLYEL
jgi:hypothetical protein